MDKTSESIVEYFLDDQQYQAKGHSKLFVDGGKKKRQQYIHTVCQITVFMTCDFSLVFFLIFFSSIGKINKSETRFTLYLSLWK